MMTTTVKLRDGSTAMVTGRSRILVGVRAGKPIAWHLRGTWRWDDQKHPLDIVAGMS